MKKKGFTLVELLVVIAIIALLMGILMPALARVRQIAFRMVCGTNLSGIGKAMLIYSNDYDDELPRAGGRASTWAATLPAWNAANRFTAYGLAADGSGGRGTISSCFYLLVKYAEVTPKSFICKGDSGTTEFKPSNAGAGNMELIDLWDFGPEPTKSCSYSYHKPFGLYALTTASEPGLAVAADRNPWEASPAGESKIARFTQFVVTGGRDIIKIGNAIQHQEDGQNVLFLDNHVNFEKNSFCGINDDNIYTWWDGTDIRKGGVPTYAAEPKDRTDSYLLHDDAAMSGGTGGTTPPPKGRTCFTAETPVWINGASVQISMAAQSIGKQICGTSSLETVDEHAGTFEVRDVVLTTGSCISVVDAHCFMLTSGQWIAAQNLTSGMQLKTANGTVGIKSVTLRTTPYTGKVYNLKVEGSDQYTVGQDQVVVRDY
ncbi:MAG TPA: type II secretion system protein [Sedimentisphaerales bacterium]|nr:type II secretion system protein [Sedimentisphaerales bacterium]